MIHNFDGVASGVVSGCSCESYAIAVTRPGDEAAMASIGDRMTQAFSEACVFLSLLFQNVIFAAS